MTRPFVRPRLQFIVSTEEGFTYTITRPVRRDAFSSFEYFTRAGTDDLYSLNPDLLALSTISLQKLRAKELKFLEVTTLRYLRFLWHMSRAPEPWDEHRSAFEKQERRRGPIV